MHTHKENHDHSHSEGRRAPCEVSIVAPCTRRQFVLVLHVNLSNEVQLVA